MLQPNPRGHHWRREPKPSSYPQTRRRRQRSWRVNIGYSMGQYPPITFLCFERIRPSTQVDHGVEDDRRQNLIIAGRA